MLDNQDFYKFDIKTAIDCATSIDHLNKEWEKLKKGESYKNISIVNLKEILEYRDEIEKELKIQDEENHKKWLKTPEGRASQLDVNMWFELCEVRDEMEIRREIHRIRKWNEHTVKVFTDPEYIKRQEERMFDGKEETFADGWTKTPYYYEFIQKLKAGLIEPTLFEEPKQKMTCTHQELLNQYNDLIKSFRMKGINLK